MGKVKKMLATKKLPRLTETYCGIELCETIHLHMPGFRFELTADQFEAFALIVQKALTHWQSLGKPANAEFVPLAGGQLPGESVYADRFDVEEQTVPIVHVHLRGLSIRPNLSNFIMLAEVITEAKKNLKR